MKKEDKVLLEMLDMFENDENKGYRSYTKLIFVLEVGYKIREDLGLSCEITDRELIKQHHTYINGMFEEYINEEWISIFDKENLEELVNLTTKKYRKLNREKTKE